jgi:pimeloyl-ACP methyl ester carboxylesterase
VSGELVRDGVRLAYRDFGGGGPSALLLHGLAGHGGEWAETAGWLMERCRVVAFDARGHGGSERRPDDVSRAAHVADTVFVVEALQLGPVMLVGQSLGGNTALLMAAERPDLVRALVVAEAGPAERDEAAVAEVEDALAAWPVPFPSRDAAAGFFGGSEAWVDGLEQRDGGWWPRFDVDVMAETLREAVSRPYWRQWKSIRCPALVVRAGNGTLRAAEARAMVERLPRARLVEIPGAGHDVHLDRPTAWRDAVLDFPWSGGAVPG